MLNIPWAGRLSDLLPGKEKCLLAMIMIRQVHSLAGPVSSPVRTAEEHLLYFGNNTAKICMLATLWSADALPYGSFTGQKEAASFVLYGSGSEDFANTPYSRLAVIQLNASVADGSIADCCLTVMVLGSNLVKPKSQMDRADLCAISNMWLHITRQANRFNSPRQVQQQR